jgi:exopolyphosphatase/guanosine-5'-triphosphate,3'-diphosphate pyrophosphatase
MIGAAIDIGSNSVHLLVAEVDGGPPRPVHDESVLLGLGAVVDLEGHIPEAERTAAIEALAGYLGIARDLGAAQVTLLATEPLRRASDRSRFAQDVLAATGEPLHVLSTDEEAELTLLGVLAGEPPDEPFLLLDIGGGSSEVVLLAPGTDPVIGVMPVGSARLTAAHVENDPPTGEEIEALRAEAHHLLTGMPAGQPRRGVVTGGSGTNLLTLVDPAGERNGHIDRSLIEDALALVASAPAARLVASSGLRERRVVQMAAGACLIQAALDCYGLASVEASDASLREGAILAVARAGDQWRARLGALISGA